MLGYENKSYKLQSHIISYTSKILILLFFLLSYNISFINKNNNSKRNLSNLNGNYSLYNYFKYPQISIIIPDIDIWIIKKNIFKLIMNLENQTLDNIEIILTSKKNELKEYKELENLCHKDKRIKLKKIKRKEPINNLFSLMSI